MERIDIGMELGFYDLFFRLGADGYIDNKAPPFEVQRERTCERGMGRACQDDDFCLDPVGCPFRTAF